MRSKEDAHDYRYFPDPDLLPIVLTEEEIAAARARLPELPQPREVRYVTDFGLSHEEAEALTEERAVADYFETLAALCGDPKQAANWVTGEVLVSIRREALSFSAVKVSPTSLAALLARIRDKTISNSIAKQVFEAMWHGGGAPEAIIEARGLRQVTDNRAIEVLVDAVIGESPEQVAQFRAGKDKVLGYFVGQVMKSSKGTADPQQVNELLLSKLRGP